jgi:hypothetical protein
VDFGIFGDVDYGSKFPFGVFTWGAGVFSDLAGGGTEPAIIHITRPGGGSDIVLSLSSDEWVNTWRPRVFGILYFIIAFAAVWFVGTKILTRGNVGDAE